MNLEDSIDKAMKQLSNKIYLYFKASTYFQIAHNITLQSRINQLKEIEITEEQENLIEYQSDIKEHATKATGVDTNVNEYVDALFFIDLIAAVEIFLSDMIKIILIKYPEKLSSEKFSLENILEFSKEELISQAAEKYVYNIMYEKPLVFLKKICNILSINEDVVKPFLSDYIEMKARRDLGIHNEWICNETYIRKLREAGKESEFSIGETTIPTKSEYIEDSSKAIFEMASEITRALLEKHIT